jgi:hypothetical protein
MPTGNSRKLRGFRVALSLSILWRVLDLALVSGS